MKLTAFRLIASFSGAIFNMWQMDRQVQHSCFQNVDIGPNTEVDGHGRHSVTPEQVNSIAT